VGSSVYSTSATAAIGMILAAKQDNLPDCVSVPERPFEQEQEMIEVEVTDETPVVNEITDEELASGSTGTILSPEDFGEARPAPEKKARTKKVKIPKRPDDKPNFLSVIWNTVQGTALKIYDKANEE
jgi:hypothetical protein